MLQQKLLQRSKVFQVIDRLKNFNQNIRMNNQPILLSIIQGIAKVVLNDASQAINATAEDELSLHVKIDIIPGIIKGHN